MTAKTRRYIWCVASLVLFFALIILLTVFFFDRLTDAVRDPARFREEVETLGIAGKLWFVFLMAAQVVLAIIPGHLFEIAGGVCFGVAEGTLLTLAGAAIGSAINFFLTRFLGMKAITSFYSEEKIKKLFFLRKNRSRNFLTFVLFLIPGIPKDMLAYFMGLTNMRFRDFILLSSLGRLPAIFLTVLGTAALQERNQNMVYLFILIFLLLLMVSVLLYFYRLKKMKEAEMQPEESPDQETPSDTSENTSDVSPDDS